MRLKNSVVLITGASSGIGEATALAFAAKGARLALCARRLERLQSVAQRCRAAGSPQVTTKRVDVSRRAEARSFVASALRDFDRVDVLVNNAGLGWAGPLVKMPEERAKDLVEVNILGVVWTTQAALEAMVPRRAGVIVNVSSIAGVRATPYSALYSATKHAVTDWRRWWSSWRWWPPASPPGGTRCSRPRPIPFRPPPVRWRPRRWWCRRSR